MTSMCLEYYKGMPHLKRLQVVSTDSLLALLVSFLMSSMFTFLSQNFFPSSVTQIRQADGDGHRKVTTKGNVSFFTTTYTSFNLLFVKSKSIVGQLFS